MKSQQRYNAAAIRTAMGKCDPELGVRVHKHLASLGVETPFIETSEFADKKVKKIEEKIKDFKHRQQKAESKKLDFITNLPQNNEQLVFSDPVRVRQILMNLISVILITIITYYLLPFLWNFDPNVFPEALKVN